MLCNICPRKCNIDRTVSTGFCACFEDPSVVRAAPHYGEEPCISGTKGSGAVFFSGCNLKCSFCQNHSISRRSTGRTVNSHELSDILLRLQDEGVHNINLVTGTHFTPVIAKALEEAKLGIPVVWNSSAYELPETLKMLDGLVQIYMPDYKYADHSLARKYSLAEDYPEIAAAAIEEMFRQCGEYQFNNGIMVSGVLIRHLILPGCSDNSMDVIDFVADHYGDKVLFSLMSQFTPMPGCDIIEKVSEDENSLLIHYMRQRHLSGFSQDSSSATEELIPDFNLQGVQI